MTIRVELLGVTSVVRALGLQAKCYDRLLDAFHSTGIKLHKMTSLWPAVVLRFFPGVLKVNGRIVLIGDGIKVAKHGKKMPAVKLLHQHSESNTKPDYIMGHSFQAIALVVKAAESFFAVPLASRIHEGVIFSNRDKRTLLDKMVSLLHSLLLSQPFYFVADAYYASRKVITPLLEQNNHLIARVRMNAVAYQSPREKKRKTRGRPRKYGKRLPLRSLFDDGDGFQTAQSPVYGENNITIRIRCVDLLWKPVGTTVRFVAVDHPSRGRCILLCSDTSLPPIAVIRLYGLRFKIELAFKQAIHTIGTYAYHFWMMDMKRIKHRSGNQHLHKESDEYRNAVRRKINAYHRFVHAGIVAQGLLQYLAVSAPALVWSSFGSWLRTVRPNIPPSEMVVANALRNSFPDFLIATNSGSIFSKFIRERLDLSRSDGSRLAA